MLRTTAASLRKPSIVRSVAAQRRSAHAISNPTLANIEKRWEAMPPTEQAELWMALRDRMKVNWAELTVQEKKAAYYIAFGAHGPRAAPPPGEGWKVAGYTFLGIGASLALFTAIRFFAKGSPSTMNKEYQEATNEYLKAQNSEPISGISSEGYSGKGMVQSAPKKKE
ncbi:putative cytochrome c oxidase polypeptide 5, mitochondrial [Mollisia scopiformis]|uniref:Cytochrome c oxidase polypeptide V n=1 Tax=Mollisia scopiformis TaxID=149040 RepID=A0A132BAI0_MOLSC|nr:putative cytochrome c oxidase polypeptide 5, mitochondrial [Mollisia scopiformis]KUJ09009.1 putative cytochrome c oxidase polypeptide 5, mitochondrial [Mollisia scopiformis]